MRDTAWISIHGSEVGYHAILPEEPEYCLVSLVAGKADDLSDSVDRVCVSEIASKSGYVREDAAVPEEGVVKRASREIHGAGHLTAVVKTGHKTKGTSEVANVHHFAVVPEKCVYCQKAVGIWNRINGGLAGYLAGLVYKPSHTVGTAQRAQVMHISVLPQKGVRLCGYWK
jgi:hypothetical protein